MKKTILIPVILLATVLLTWYACEKDVEEPPAGQTNKIEFKEISVDTVSYREATISYSLGNLNINDFQSLGICYNTSGKPTKENNAVSLSHNSSGTKTIEGLSPDMEYYFRFYAEIGDATVYSTEENFSTNPLGTPSLTTAEITNIDTTSATSGGNISDNGGLDITARGVCWSTSQNPTINDDSTSNGSGTGSFASEITGLTDGTKYYVQAYATNEIGTAYGNERSFSTGISVQAYFEADQTTIPQGGTINFTDQSTGNPTSWSWDFGDGSTSTSQNPSHTYSSAGTYTVELTVTNDYGSDTETKTDYINVSVPTIDFNGTLYVYPVDNSTSIAWGGYGTEITDGNGAVSDTVGEANTSAIVSQLGSDGHAAYLCDTLSAYGYNDWYLPAKSELNALYQNKDAIGGLSSDDYWSSTESGANGAWGQYFGNGGQYNFDKISLNRVRCVRRD